MRTHCPPLIHVDTILIHIINLRQSRLLQIVLTMHLLPCVCIPFHFIYSLTESLPRFYQIFYLPPTVIDMPLENHTYCPFTSSTSLMHITTSHHIVPCTSGHYQHVATFQTVALEYREDGMWQVVGNLIIDCKEWLSLFAYCYFFCICHCHHIMEKVCFLTSSNSFLSHHFSSQITSKGESLMYTIIIHIHVKIICLETYQKTNVHGRFAPSTS